MTLFSLWGYEVKIFQIALLFILFEVPSLVRRVSRVAYTPIYFMFFPLGHSDQLYARFFAEDYFYGAGEVLDPPQVRKLKFRIMSLAAVSMFFSAVFAPVVVGFVGAIFFEAKVFSDFVVLLMIVKFLLLSISLYAFSQTVVGRLAVARFLVVGLYFLYMCVVFVFLVDTFEWTRVSLEGNSISGVVRLALTNLVYNHVWAYVIVPAVSAAAAFLLAQDSVRESNLSSGNDPE